MTSSLRLRFHWIVLVLCTFAGFLVFQFFGNANRGYIDTSSLFRWWGSQWFLKDSEAEHGPLIAGLSIWLFWRNLRRFRIPNFNGSTAIGWALVAMLGGLALHSFGYVVQQARISIVACLIFVWGLLVFGGGRRWGWAAVFPLAFMLFSIPINVLDSVGFYLRLWVSESSTIIAHFCGIEVLRNGTQLISPDGNYQYEVAAACSGVRSLVALMAISILEAYLALRLCSRRIVAFLLCLPLTYLGNVVRITAVIFAGEWFGQNAGLWVHDNLGLVVYLVVMIGVLLGVAAIRRWWPEPVASPVEASRAPSKEARPSVRASILVVAAVLVGSATTIGFAEHWRKRPFDGVAGVLLDKEGINPVPLPMFVPPAWIGQYAPVTQIERETLPQDTGFSRLNYVSSRNPNEQVYVSLVLSGRDRTSIHRPEICLVGQGWTIDRQSSHVFSDDRGGEVPTTVLHISREAVNKGGERIVLRALYCYWFVGREDVVATHVERLWLTAVNTLRGRADRWAYVVSQSVVLEGHEESTLARIQSVIAGVLPVFQPRTTTAIE